MIAKDPPIPVLHVLRKLGNDIRDARRRRIPVAILAERASTSRLTLSRVEKGNPSVSMRIYARCSSRSPRKAQLI